MVHLSDLPNEKIHDIKYKRILTQAASALLYQLALAPFTTHNCTDKLSTLHNINEFSKTITNLFNPSLSKLNVDLLQIQAIIY